MILFNNQQGMNKKTATQKNTKTTMKIAAIIMMFLRLK